MSLQKQLARISLTNGLDKISDERLVIPTKLTRADNVEFDDQSTVVRRGGQVRQSLTTLAAYPSNTIGQGFRLFTHQGVAYIENAGGVHRVWRNGGTIPVLNPGQPSGFTQPAHFFRASMQTKRVGAVTPKGTAYNAGTPLYDGSHDMACIGSVTCHAWETRDVIGAGRQTIRVTVTDENTGIRVYDQQIVDTTAGASPINVKPRVVNSSNKGVFIVYYATFNSGSTSYIVRAFTVSVAGVVTAAATVFTSAATGGSIESTVNDAVLYDAAPSPDGTVIGMVARDATGTGTTLLFKSLDTSTGATTLSSTTLTASARVTALACLVSYDNTNYRVHAFYGIGTAVAKGQSWIPGGGTVVETTLGTGATTVGRLTAIQNSVSQIYLAFDTASAGTTSSQLRLSSFTHTYGTLTECAGPSPWFIAGRLVNSSARSRIYLPMVLLSTQYQTTTFLCDFTSMAANLGVSGSTGPAPHVVARIDYAEGAIDLNRWQRTNRVPAVVDVSGNIKIPYLKFETDLRIAGTSNDTAFAVAQATVDFTSQLQHDEINGISWLAGACPHIFDGSNYVEEGFHHGPEIITVGAAAASGNYTFPNASATYSFCFTMSWQDAQGNWWESAPSNIAQVTIVGGSGNYSISPTVLVPPSQKPNAQLTFYRTKGSSTDTALYLGQTSMGVSISNDTDLALSEQLYTAGNILPNTPAPACRHVTTWQRRLVISGCKDGSRIYYSKPSDVGFGIEFCSTDGTHQAVIPPAAGRVVGTRELDDNLIVFAENFVGAIYGTGPAPTGLQGVYSDFATKAPQMGTDWNSPKSILRAPEGVWFRSNFGLRLFSRQGQIGTEDDGTQTGSLVDGYLAANLVAVSGQAKQHARFYQADGTVLLWDYQWRQWVRQIGMSSVDACFADGRYYHLSNIGSTPMLRYIDNSVFVDVDDSGNTNQGYTGYIETAWLSFAGMQGFQRVYRLDLVGKNMDNAGSNQNFGIYVGYDFSGSALALEASADVTPVNAGIVQIQHHFIRQKCEAMKLGIYFRPSNNDAGRFRLTNLTLQVGVKPTNYKLPSSQRI